MAIKLPIKMHTAARILFMWDVRAISAPSQQPRPVKGIAMRSNNAQQPYRNHTEQPDATADVAARFLLPSGADFSAHADGQTYIIYKLFIKST